MTIRLLPVDDDAPIGMEYGQAPAASCSRRMPADELFDRIKAGAPWATARHDPARYDVNHV